MAWVLQETRQTQDNQDQDQDQDQDQVEDQVEDEGDDELIGSLGELGPGLEHAWSIQLHVVQEFIDDYSTQWRMGAAAAFLASRSSARPSL